MSSTAAKTRRAYRPPLTYLLLLQTRLQPTWPVEFAQGLSDFLRKRFPLGIFRLRLTKRMKPLKV